MHASHRDNNILLNILTTHDRVEFYPLDFPSRNHASLF